MEFSLQGLYILIIGGDKREIELYKHLCQRNASVGLYGFDTHLPVGKPVDTGRLGEKISNSDVIITPLTGIEKDGQIYAPYTEEKINIFKPVIWNNLQPETLFISGFIHPSLKAELEKKKVRYCETREMDEISILNAIPTAEGAIEVAMAHTPITIHGSSSLVLGFGRCGFVLAEKLKALGASVSVAARRNTVLAWVQAFSMEPVKMDLLSQHVHQAEIIFNTVPARIIDEKVIYKIKKDAIIVDIAAYPGGVDPELAERAGIPLFVLPGLPGKVAPKTAGTILCSVYPSLILSILKGG